MEKMNEGYQPEDKTSSLGDRPNPPKMPSGSGVSLSNNKSKDNEIKMQMAKDIICSIFINNPEANSDQVELACSVSEEIFDRFNK